MILSVFVSKLCHLKTCNCNTDKRTERKGTGKKKAKKKEEVDR